MTSRNLVCLTTLNRSWTGRHPPKSVSRLGADDYEPTRTRLAKRDRQCHEPSIPVTRAAIDPQTTWCPGSSPPHYTEERHRGLHARYGRSRASRSVEVSHYRLSGHHRHRTFLHELRRPAEGLSQTYSYGDDAHMATNFPVFQLTHIATKRASYLCSFDFSNLAVKPGSSSNATIDVPAHLSAGTYDLEAIANGIASAAVSVTITA